MKFYKILVWIVVLTICVNSIASASSANKITDYNLSFDATTDTVSIVGTHPEESSTYVTVSVKHENGTKPVYWYETATNSDGEFEISFKMDRQCNDNGVYNVLFGGIGLEANSDSFEFYVTPNETELISGVSDAETVVETIQAYGNSIGIKTEDEVFSTLADKAVVYSSLTNEGFNKSSEVKHAFYGFSAIQQLKEASESEAADVFKKYSKHLGIKLVKGDYYDKIRADKVKAWVNAKLSEEEYSIDNLEKLPDAFADISAIALINDIDSSNRSMLLNYVQEFNDKNLCDISLDAYTNSDFTDMEKIQIISYVIASKDVSYFDSYDDIESSIAASCEKVLNERPKNPSTGLNGVDGGSGASKKETTTISATYKYVEESLSKRDENISKMNFEDLDETHWAYEHIEKLTEKNIVSGTGRNTFEPERSITREEFVKMIVGAFDLAPMDDDAGFLDVKQGDWYAESVNIAYANGIINGVREDVFGVGAKITREDLATILYRVILSVGINLEKGSEVTSFSDANQISGYAKDAVEYLCNAGVINGFDTGKFEPKLEATRAMAAKIISIVLEGGGLN